MERSDFRRIDYRGAELGVAMERVSEDDLIARHAQRVVLRDGRRQMVAQLVAGYNGGELELRGPRGAVTALPFTTRPEGRVRADSVTVLEMNDKNSRAHAVVGVLNEQQRFRAGIGECRDGQPRLDLYDAEGETRALLRLDDRGRPKFYLDP